MHGKCALHFPCIGSPSHAALRAKAHDGGPIYLCCGNVGPSGGAHRSANAKPKGAFGIRLRSSASRFKLKLAESQPISAGRQ